MNRFDKIFRTLGILISYSILTSMAIILIRYDFNTDWEWFIDYLAINVGALGMLIFWKWAKG